MINIIMLVSEETSAFRFFFAIKNLYSHDSDELRHAEVTGFFFFVLCCFVALHGVAASCHVIHRQERGNGGGAAEPIPPLGAGAGSPQAAGVARCPPQWWGRVQLAPAATGKGVWRESALRGRERLPARRHAHRLALCKKTIYLLLACKVSQDGSVPQHTPEEKKKKQISRLQSAQAAITRSKWRRRRRKKSLLRTCAVISEPLPPPPLSCSRRERFRVAGSGGMWWVDRAACTEYAGWSHQSATRARGSEQTRRNGFKFSVRFNV